MTGYQWADKPAPLSDWVEREPSRTRPMCTAVPLSLRGAWTSDDVDARAWARRGCDGCPIRQRCLTDALNSGVKTGVFAGWSLDSAYERKKAEQWLRAQKRAS